MDTNQLGQKEISIHTFLAEGDDTTRDRIHAYGARTVVNTVPALVIREPMIREMHSDAVIIDIASKALWSFKFFRS